VGAVQRKLLVLENQGGAQLFGEPALKLADLMRTDSSGRGYVSLLAADRLIGAPQLYATFLLWLMSELFEGLPEVGDPEKPKLIFFFDEAHLLFEDAPKALLDKVEQVVRLIRSKGVGVYFVTQNPADVPDTVLGQLGNRIQHGLRAYTPAEQRGLKAAAQSFRTNPKFDTAEAIQALGVGEALVSVLDEKGAPTMVEKTSVRPPNSRIGPLTDPERRQLMAQSPVGGIYDQAQDRDSAFEVLKRRAEQKTAAADAPPSAAAPRTPAARPSQGEQMIDAFAKSMVRTIGTQVGRLLIRGILGGIMAGAGASSRRR
jgi:DNA helicase HerA-like ATPase